MATSNRDRVNRGMDLLKDGLAPFVAQEMRGRYGDLWWEQYRTANPAVRAGSPEELDVQGLLKVMRENWNDVFGKTLGPFERNLVHELIEARNRWAHQAAFTTDDTDRVLDSIARLLHAVSAHEPAEAVERERQVVRRAQYEEYAKREERRASAAALQTRADSGLRPWRDIITPHPDVQSGSFQQAEFAADLAQVHRGGGTPEYADPIEFFRRTYLTEGLRTLLKNGILRLAGVGGDPVVELQTNFGGGKTHSMLALYHIASDIELQDIPGLEPIIQEVSALGVDVTKLPVPRRAVLVGTALGPNEVRRKDDGTEIRTLWGELAWQLGRRKGFALVAESDRAGTNPGTDVLVQLFQQFSPALILIDEWVAFVRQLHSEDLAAGSFDANLSFAQSLTEAARQAPRTLLVASLPASQIEVGGTYGQEALDRLRNTFGRMQASWRPATTEEGFEIVRRRLFEPIQDPELYAARDGVVRAYMEMYRRGGSQFPSKVQAADYQQRMQAAYPIHPELFDQLYGAWSTLDKFQRTRGVLRLMASVIHTLWRRQDASLLIMPASIPMDAGPVVDELTRYLDDSWKPVIERDVDGERSVSLQLDSEDPNFGRLSAARRVARTIYLGSAPTYHAAQRGIEDRDIKLGSAQPGESVAVFGDALRKLSDRATYLYVDRGRYWFSTQPSVTRVAQGHAQSLPSEDVAAEIVKRLRDEQKQRGDFMSVHPAPQSSADVRDEPTARLVILDPKRPHRRGAGHESAAIQLAEEMLNQRGDSPRRYRNTLVFVAADRDKLGGLEEAVRQYLAWSQIVNERTVLNLDEFQMNQAQTKADEANKAIAARLPEVYQWVLAPRQQLGENTVEWDERRTQGEGSIPQRVSARLHSDGLLYTQLSGTQLRMELDKVPLWRGDHVSVRQLAEDFAQYLYLPRLKNDEVLLGAIASGVGNMVWRTETFAVAERYDEVNKRYVGLKAGELVRPMNDPQWVVVKPDVAQRQIERDRPPIPVVVVGGTDSGGDGKGDTGSGGGTPPPLPPKLTPKPITRYWGTVDIDPSKMATGPAEIGKEIVRHLAVLDGAKVSVTIEITASVPNGIPEDVQRVLNENSQTLKFRQYGFEDE